MDYNFPTCSSNDDAGPGTSNEEQLAQHKHRINFSTRKQLVDGDGIMEFDCIPYCTGEHGSNIQPADIRLNLPTHSHIYDYPPMQPILSGVLEYANNIDYPCSSQYRSHYNSIAPPIHQSQLHAQHHHQRSINSLAPPHEQQLSSWPSNLAAPSSEFDQISLEKQHQNKHQHQQKVAELSSGMQRVHMWTQHNAPSSTSFQQPHFLQKQQDSGVHSMTQSSATSVMSSIHSASQISGLSSIPDHELYDSNNYGINEHLTIHQTERFENIPLNFRHANAEQVQKAVAELVPLLTDTEEDVVRQALLIMQNVVKEVCYRQLYGSDCGRAIVAGILHALKTFKQQKFITRLALGTLYHISADRPFGLESVIQKINEEGAKCLEDVLSAIRIREHSCFKYAIIILHNLISNPKIGLQIIQYTRNAQTLKELTECLNERNEKLLAIIVDSIQFIVNRSAEQKLFFVNLGGSSRLIDLLKCAQYDNLISRTAKLLKTIVDCDSKRMVEAGAFEVLHLHLNPMNSRLIRDLLFCLRYLSDVSTQNRDVGALLGKLIYLFGIRRMEREELKIQLMCVQILSNLSANNKSNKEFLVTNRIIDTAIFVLFETESQLEKLRTTSNNLSGSQLEEVQDNTLTILRNVCSGHSLAGKAQFEIMRKRQNGDILLQTLSKKRVVLLRRTLRILCQTATNDANLPRFRETFNSETTANEPPIVPYIKEIVECFQIASENYKEQIEGVNLAEIVQDSMNILQSLCRDNFMLDTIVEYLRRSPITIDEYGTHILLPQFALRDENLKTRALAFLSELMRHPQASQFVSEDADTMKILNYHALAWNVSIQQHIAVFSRRCLDWIQRHSAQNRPGYCPVVTQETKPGQFPFNLNQTASTRQENLQQTTPKIPLNSVQQVYNNYIYNNQCNLAKNGITSTDNLQLSSNEYDANYNNQNENHIQNTVLPPPDCMPSTPFHALSYFHNETNEVVYDTVLESASTIDNNCGDNERGDQKINGIAARCSTPVEQITKHDATGTVVQTDASIIAVEKNTENSASTLTKHNEKCSTIFGEQKFETYDDDFCIANAMCGTPSPGRTFE